MAAVFYTSGERAFLKRPHVGRAFFVELDFPDGVKRLHNGVGTVSVGGYDWRGVSDPFGGVMVSISEIEDPRFGQAPSIDITLSGVNAAFLASVKDIAREIEGRSAAVWWTMVDQETEQTVFGLKPLFPGAKMSAPQIIREGLQRYVTLTIESFWQSQNYPFGGKWNDAQQRARYPGDKGLAFMGVKIQETRK